MQRRDFLTLAAFFPALAGASTRNDGYNHNHFYADLHAAIQQVAQSLPVSPAIAQHWIQNQPLPRAELTTRLAQRLPATARPQNVRALLNAQIRQDFHTGNTHNLAGWVLADTELKLCALACLASSAEQTEV